jgi:hypothetical protein
MGLTQPGACHPKNPVKTPGLTLVRAIPEKACQKFVWGVHNIKHTQNHKQHKSQNLAGSCQTRFLHVDRSPPTLEVYVVMNLCIFLWYAALNTTFIFIWGRGCSWELYYGSQEALLLHWQLWINLPHCGHSSPSPRDISGCIWTKALVELCIRPPPGTVPATSLMFSSNIPVAARASMRIAATSKKATTWRAKGCKCFLGMWRRAWVEVMGTRTSACWFWRLMIATMLQLGYFGRAWFFESLLI